MARGYPDYSKPVYPSKPSLFSGQTRFNLRAVVPVGANTSATGDLYTVPAGKRLTIGYIKLSCNKSAIQQAQLMLDDVVFCGMYFDMIVVIPLTPISGFIFEAGEVISGKHYNTLDSAVSFTAIFVGFLEDV